MIQRTTLRGCLLMFSMLLLCSSSLKAQSPFQGKIDYLLLSRDSTISIAITAVYLSPRILFDMRVVKAPAALGMKTERIILDFGNGFIDRIDMEAKKIRREPLTGPQAKRDLPGLTAGPDTSRILGYLVIPYKSPGISKQEMKDSMLVTTTGDVTIRYAPSLLFPVPDSMKMVQMVPLFTNGYVALGSTISISVGKLNLQLNTSALNIRKQKIKASTFTVYKSYAVELDD